ncbi:germination protein, Ger(X)C family [Desulfosporosinus orientis DSM 765]|uniref:Germination protein, Ger(X)C family n=1 Tax=Desulfosporosinus orientis (strain ATCC 19365 / DSM 765 / NCIMB 8382 / VKM B-1628 / Singapore I) TaxID=768706 RepID=G7W5F0_DESOD|nr:germination protein, Ger(X)C family [Desulfosporosinus orientis DSM 765]
MGLVILILLQSVLLTGCWDSKEVEKLAVVTIVGIDYARKNGRDMWTVSARTMSPKPKGKGEEQSAGTVDQDILMVGKGLTQQEAILDYSAHTSRTPFYGHISAYLIGEEAAREKMSDIIENVMRFWQTRPKHLIVITKGEALQVLEAGAAVEKTLFTEIKDLAEYKAEATGYSYGTIMSEFTAWLLSPDKDAVATLVSVVPSNLPGSDKQNLMQGLAVFRLDKLVGWLNREETRGYLLIAQKISRGQMSIPVEKDGKLFSYFLGSSTSKIEPLITGDNISYHVTIEAKGEIDDNAGIELGAEDIKGVEAAISNKLQDLAMMAVGKAKKLDSDFLGFSAQLHRHDPTTWESFGPDWRKSFRNAGVEIMVDAKVLRTGKIGKKLDIQQ